jgi:hypothetical protein
MSKFILFWKSKNYSALFACKELFSKRSMGKKGTKHVKAEILGVLVKVVNSSDAAITDNPKFQWLNEIKILILIHNTVLCGHSGTQAPSSVLCALEGILCSVRSFGEPAPSGTPTFLLEHFSFTLVYGKRKWGLPGV